MGSAERRRCSVTWIPLYSLPTRLSGPLQLGETEPQQVSYFLSRLEALRRALGMKLIDDLNEPKRNVGINFRQRLRPFFRNASENGHGGAGAERRPAGT